MSRNEGFKKPINYYYEEDKEQTELDEWLFDEEIHPNRTVLMGAFDGK